MGDKHKASYRNYKLISAYIRLNEDKYADEIQNNIINQRIKGFHIFCLIVFSSFLLDGLLPHHLKPTEVRGVKTIMTELKEIQTKEGPKQISLPTLAQVNTSNGSFITADISGIYLRNVKARIHKTPIFSIAQGIELPGAGYKLTRYFDFHGNLIFWPLLALLISGIGVFSKKYQGSTTLSALSVLNIIPFFIVVYLT